MKTKLVSLLILFSLFVNTGCVKNDPPDLPDIGISTDRLNKDLRLVVFPTFNTFKIGESVNLEVQIESDLEVEISPDSDAQIFALNTKAGEWQKVKEVPDLGVFDPQTFILSHEDGGIQEVSISLYPDLPNRSEPANLLIVVIGNVVQKGKVSDQKVGAYIIVKLRP